MQDVEQTAGVLQLDTCCMVLGTSHFESWSSAAAATQCSNGAVNHEWCLNDGFDGCFF
jgi:hypothetical protein